MCVLHYSKEDVCSTFIYFLMRDTASKHRSTDREQPPTTRTTLKTVARTAGRMQPDFYLQTYTFINYRNRRSFMSKLTIMTCCGIILEMPSSLRSRKNEKRCVRSPPIGNHTSRLIFHFRINIILCSGFPACFIYHE